MRKIRFALVSAITTVTVVTALAAPPAAMAQGAERRPYHLPPQPLADALRALSAESDRSIAAAAKLLTGKTTKGLDGNFTVEEAAAVLLEGSGLRARMVAGGLVIETAGRATPSTVASESAPDIIVTGSRIRGAPISSPVITIDRDAIVNAGLANIADAARRIPQNFGGGQNPGIGFNVPEANGADVGGGSSVNLRGLGSDATLTLLNGHRLSYSAVTQSVDISAIPFSAVDRVEIVPDGASAIFGSDAVAGVVNVILRRNFDGLETSARVGGSTDGGNFTQQYGLTAGRVWNDGGLLLAYEYGSNSAIEARQRFYAATRTPGLTLYPALRHHNAALTGHQSLTSGLSLEFDGIFNKRWSDSMFPLNFAGDLAVSRGTSFTLAQSFAVAPTLKLDLPSDWQMSLAGSYGQDRVDYGGDYYFGSTRISAGDGYYRNRARAAELSGNGTVFALPGGSAKLAIGTGYRGNSFQRFTSSGGQNIDRSQDSYYAFGELNLPLVSPAQDMSLIHRLNVSAALRYENYPGIGDVVTPKLGLIYAPSADVDIKGSVGRSFRAPTLYQQYQPATAYLVSAASYGGSTAAGATALYVQGGNADLQPERSRNWSATLAVHPRSWPGFDLEISYFSVRYTNRIVTPIGFTSVALSNPAYADLVVRNPSAQAQAALIARATAFNNISSNATYDPAQVVAIIDNSSVNAGRQTVHGLDVLGRYSTTLGQGTVSGSLNGSYLISEQRLTPALPTTQLAGTLFNPPHLRVRGEVSWSAGPLTLAGDVDYIGSVRDTRDTPTVRVAGMMPVNLSVRYRPKTEAGPFRGLDLGLSLQNLFNDTPTPIATSLFYDTPYDSTNYLPFGRQVSVSVTKKW